MPLRIMWKSITRALLLAGACCVVSTRCEEPAPKPAPAEGSGEAAKAPAKGDLPGAVDWWAENLSFVEDKGAVVLSGSAWVKVSGIKLEADHIVFFRQTRELYAEGHIRLREGESEMAAEVAYLDVANDRGYLVDATLRVSKEQGTGQKPLNLTDRKHPEDLAKAISNQQALVNTRDPYGVYLQETDDPQGRLNFIFKAQTIVRQSRLHYTAKNAFMTNDDMAQPLYGLKVGQLDFILHDEPDPDNPGKTQMKPQIVRAAGARFKIGPLTLFPLPTVTYDITRHQAFFRADYGRSTRWGYFGLFRVGWGLGGHENKLFDPTRIYFDIDMRQDRGPALGGEFKYQTGLRPQEPDAANAFERGRGSIRVYGIDEVFTNVKEDQTRSLDDRTRRVTQKIDGDPRRKYDANLLYVNRRARDKAGPPSQDLDLYRDDVRALVNFQHHQPLLQFAKLDNVQLDFKYQRQTDRDFLLEYFPNNYYTDNQPEALASIRKGGDNYMAELLYRTSPQTFDGSPPRSPVDYGTFTDYEPALTYSLMQMRLPGGFYLGGEAQAARMRREFERKVVDEETYEAGRLSGRFEIERPFHFMGMNWRPHVGLAGAAYDNSRSGGDSVLQYAPTYGLDVSTRLYGEFPGVRNEALGISGFRHIIEPHFEYVAVGDTSEDPDRILDFDEVDNLQGVHVVRLELDQLFQNGTKAGKSNTIGGLNMWLDIYPRETDSRRLLGGDHQDLFHANGFINVGRAVQLTADMGASLETKRVETAVYGVNFDPGGRWRLNVSERFNYADRDRGILGSDGIFVRLDVQLSERWGLAFQQSTERKAGFLIKKGKNQFDLMLSRRYGPLVGSVRYTVNHSINDSGWHFSLAPAFAYRNLVVPSANLVVPAAQVDAAAEAPEEQVNLDPFNQINKKKISKRSSGGNNAPANPGAAPTEPAPKPEGDKPKEGGAVPAPPAESSAPAAPTDVAQPALPPMKPKPSNLDQDDWGAPAPGPKTSAAK
ncbi:MAG: hypothetical protein HY291_16135 [Planctomycetes bacterium]|nr:hypothetical protein [Planctomycetota bacterium]